MLSNNWFRIATLFFRARISDFENNELHKLQNLILILIVLRLLDHELRKADSWRTM